MSVAEAALHAFTGALTGPPEASVVVVTAPPHAVTPSVRQRLSVSRRQLRRLPPAATHALIASLHASRHCRRSDTASARGTRNAMSANARTLGRYVIESSSAPPPSAALQSRERALPANGLEDRRL